MASQSTKTRPPVSLVTWLGKLTKGNVRLYYERIQFFHMYCDIQLLIITSWIRGSDKLNNDPNISHFKDVAEIPVELMPSKGIFNKLLGTHLLRVCL